MVAVRGAGQSHSYVGGGVAWLLLGNPELNTYGSQIQPKHYPINACYVSGLGDGKGQSGETQQLVPTHSTMGELETATFSVDPGPRDMGPIWYQNAGRYCLFGWAVYV